MEQLFHLLIVCLCSTGCIDEEPLPDTPWGNMEALWRIIDEHYCFFEYKNIDWQEVYQCYSKQMGERMGLEQQSKVLSNMLAELKDGHVSLYTSLDHGRYWEWHESYPSNFSDTLLNKYLGTGYRITTGMRYRILDDNIGYVYLASFSNGMGADNLDNALYHPAPCNGLIIDIRNNGGGMLTSAEQLTARFTNRELLVGYTQHKTGKGHRDSSELREQRLKPNKGLRWQKKVVVLVSRQVFNVANEFVKYMKECPNVTIVGDRTGRGAGLPFSNELPNGWGVCLSTCPMYDVNKQSAEFGIDPDCRVDTSHEDFPRGKDTIIEFARRILSTHDEQTPITNRAKVHKGQMDRNNLTTGH